MRRRDLLLSAAALTAGGGLYGWRQRIDATVRYPGRDEGHWLRDARLPPDCGDTVETEVLIAGAGVAGLTAAWTLARRGVADVLLLEGPERYGNAACGRDGELAFPTGAHYLPLPSMESRHVREMLAEFGVIEGDPYGERPRFDERYLVHGPADRVLFEGAWQDGYLPTEGVGAAERAEHERFFAMMEQYSGTRGSDGRRAFAVPLELSSADARFRALDRVSFRQWLGDAGLHAPTLHWYLDYCCRDDYGRHYGEVSAWAGLHYFCSRGGLAANAEQGAVLTWPEGLAALAMQLGRALPRNQGLCASIAQLRRVPGGVEAICVDRADGHRRCFRVKARQAIAAVPLYVLQHVLVDPEQYGFVAPRDVPQYAPWLVSNFIMRAFPDEGPGAPLAWDNVVYREPGLGYVVSTHQEIRRSPPPRTVFTAYHALSDLPPGAGRAWLEQAGVDELAALAGRDLKLAYGWRLPLCVERVEITVRAHAMAIPQPGFLSAPGRVALRTCDGPIHFAHSDLSGLSLFEEAAWWGCRAATRVAESRTPVGRGG
jgi:hypothetical protein